MIIQVRPALRHDAAAMCAVLNPLVRAGGSTAIETEATPESLAAWLWDDPRLVCCHVAMGPEGGVAGFQWLTRTDPDTGDIASFARPAPKLPGVGRALFAATLAAARAAGLTAITACIRADNGSGLGYYAAMGFEDHAVIPAVPLADGTPVDRVVKRRSL